MRTFEVSLNGKKLCTAGVGDDGVLTVIVGSVSRKSARRGQEDLWLDVGGLVRSREEGILWQHRRLRCGDEIRVKVAEAEAVSKPRRPKPADPALLAKAHEKNLENEAKRLGWKIVKPNKSLAK